MIGRRAIVGLSLLCALMFSAVAAQSALAVKGTTAFTCVEKAKGDFSDAHCDKAVTAGTGTFGHVEIGESTTELHVTNNKTKASTTEHTPAVLKGEAFKVPTEIDCTKVEGTSSTKNVKEGIDKVMANEGIFSVKYSECTVTKPTNEKGEHVCKVKEPIEAKGTTTTRVQVIAEKETMGVEFKPEAGKPFTQITYEGAECPLKGLTANVEGTALATGARGPDNSVSSSGATLVFTDAMTTETLKFGGKPAGLESTVTVSMGNKEKTENPITLTTTAN
jgi:hypothetical protein